MKQPTIKGAALAALLATLSIASTALAQEPAPAPAPAPSGKSVTLTSEGGKCAPMRPLLQANADQIAALCAPGEKAQAVANNQGCAEGDVISVTVTCGGGQAEQAPAPAPAPAAGGPKTLTLASEGGKCVPPQAFKTPENAEKVKALCTTPEEQQGAKMTPNAGSCTNGEVVSLTVTCGGGSKAPEGAGASGSASAGFSAKATVPTIAIRKVTTPIIVAGAVSGVALAAGVIFGVMALSDHSSYKDQPNDDVGRSGENKALYADLSFGLAALAGFTALALYLLPEEEAAPPPDAAPPASPPAPAARRHRVILPSLASALKGELLRF